MADSFPVDYRGPFPDGTILGNVNQYHLAKLTQQQRLNSVYAKLVTNSVPTTDESGVVECWIIQKSGNGVDVLPNGRIRVNALNGKQSATVFIWEYFHGAIPANEEISHICNGGKNGCIRPSHMNSETRQINRSRDGCCGYIRIGQAVYDTRECQHNPRCKVCRTANRITSQSVNGPIM